MQKANSFYLTIYEIFPDPSPNIVWDKRPLFGHEFSLRDGHWGPQHREEIHRQLDELLDKSFHLLNHGY